MGAYALTYSFLLR